MSPFSIRVKRLAFLTPISAAPLAAHAAEPASGLTASAEEVFHLGPIPVTNSMLMTWLVGIGLVLLIRLTVGRPRLIPTRAQAVLESLIEGVRDIVAPIVGGKALKAALPLLLAFFTFILAQNWSGLIPGVGNILVPKGEEWVELVRPANADMNGTFALALISFVAWFIFVMRFAGPKFLLKDLFGNKADKRDVPAVIYYLLFPIFFGVGCLEVVSILFRPISLSFRLYGNIFGGENLLHSMSAIFRWGLPAPFYFMELLVGLVQAFVFTLLVSVYIGLICNHGDGHEEGHSEPHEGGH